MTPKQKKQQKMADFIKQEYQQIISYIRKQNKNSSPSDAEDILSAVVLSILKLINFGTIIDNIPSYLYKSIRNKIIDLGRKKDNKETLFVKDFDNSSYLFIDTINEINLDIQKKIEIKELNKIIFLAVDSLNKSQKKIWLGTEIDDLSYQELSEKLKESENTLYVRKNRANKKIKEFIENYYKNGGKK